MTSSKYDFANYDQFPPNFRMTCKTIYVSAQNLKSFVPLKAGVMGRRNSRMAAAIEMKRDCLNFEQL